MTALLALVLICAGLAAGRPARARRYVELVLVGCNDDFNSRASNLAELLAAGPDVIFIQEGKAADYRALLDDAGRQLLPIGLWGIHQDTSSPDRAGTVVIWRHDVITRTGSGFTFAVKAGGLLARWVAWVRGTVAGCRVFLFSAHRPPVRDRHWWAPFDLALWARLDVALAARRIVLGQMDSNQHGGPPHLPAGLRWVAVGASIDGFIISSSVDVVAWPIELPYGSSDHHPIQMTVRLPTKTRPARSS
jgi:hypothetical protein